MPRLAVRCISTQSIQREVERRIATLRARAEDLKDHKGHPQVIESLHLTLGEISGLEGVLDMIENKTERVAWW